jgi:hypothetical protein
MCMHLRSERGLRQFQLIDAGFSRYRASVFLATLLVVGLVGIAPSIAVFVQMIGLPVPRPLLLAVVAVGGLYVALIVAMGRAVLGTCISFIVTSTFVANIPLTAAAPTYPGNLGPQLFLFQLPMLVLVIIYAINGEYSLDSFTRVEYAFGAFVLWSVLSALVGVAPRPYVALYFSIYMFVVWIGFGITLRSVRQEVLQLRGVLSVFLIAVYGHVVFAVAQFFNQGPFGFTVLGETNRSFTRNIVDLGVLGEYHIGVFLSGFTGGNSPLSILLILAIPIALALWRERDTIEQPFGFFSVLVMVGILRLTAKDAARGALLITILCFMLFWLWKARKEIGGLDRIRKLVQRGKSYSILAIASIGIILYPSTTTGGTVKLGNSEKNGSNTGHAGGSTPSVINGNQPSSNPITVSIPYFNIASLGIRLQQYVGAILIFLDHPIFGVGGANYPFVAKEYGLPAKLAGNWFPLHNMYLAILAETGLPGFVFFMLAFVFVFWNGLRRFLKQNSDTLLAAGLLAGMVGYAAVAFWETNLRFVMVVPFWMLMGALVAENERL